MASESIDLVKQSLITLPVELQTQIYSLALGDKDDEVILIGYTISEDGSADDTSIEDDDDDSGERNLETRALGLREPPLLLVSKQVRHIAGKVFYSERVFRLDFAEMDPNFVLRWQEKQKLVETEFNVTPEVALGPWSIRPNWENLIKWLELYHAGTVWVGFEGASAQSLEYITIVGMFEMMKVWRSPPWKLVETWLSGQRKILKECPSPRWEDYGSNNAGWK
jgi:hypothetical protein